MANKTLIIGGTGTIGQVLVDLLAQSEQEFIVLARTAEKAKALREKNVEVAIGVLGVWDSIEPLLEKVDCVYLLTGPSPDQVALQNGLIDRAKKKGVRKIIKISTVGAETGSPIHLMDWHGQIEDHLIASGLEYVILRPHSFMQNMFMNIPTIREQSAYYQSTGDAKVPLIDIRDIAQASFECIVSDTHNNGIYTLTGCDCVSNDEMAHELSKAAGHKIHCIDIPLEAHREGMVKAGLPEWLADDLIGLNREYLKGAINEVTPDYEKMTGLKQKTIQDFARDYADFFK
jgi:uncharacterized protein YbjT (DUF2867 family)